MTIARQNLPNGNIKLTLTIPKNRVKEVYDKELASVLSEVEVPGFRKGKAPKKLAEEKIDKKRLTEQVATKLIPEAYQEAIQKENIKPIVNPQVRLTSANENQDWQIEIETCEAPQIVLGNYKEEIKKINATGKIWVPTNKTAHPEMGKRKEATESGDERLQKILNSLLSREAGSRSAGQFIKLEIPALLVENELNRRLASLINKTEKLGLTLEQYLTSINQSVEQLKESYQKAAEEFWKLEFILNKIADEEKIAVEQTEIEKVINQAKNEKEKKALESQRYFLAQILRRQKTLDFLLNL